MICDSVNTPTISTRALHRYLCLPVDASIYVDSRPSNPDHAIYVTVDRPCRASVQVAVWPDGEIENLGLA